MSSAIRALSNVDAGVVKAEIEIAATPARVFQSWRPSWDDYAVMTMRYDIEPTATEPSLARTCVTNGSSPPCLPQCDPSPDRP